MPATKFTRRRKTKAPCLRCGMHRERCICHHIPCLDFKTKVSLIIHAKEIKRTTNTGRLAVAALKNSAVYLHGHRDQQINGSDLIESEFTNLFFFPVDDAAELNRDFVLAQTKPIHLIVPDGNWRQAGKVRNRIAELQSLPCVKITTPNLARFHLRRESSECGMSTLQAIAEALRILEGEAAALPLLQLYDAKLRATLYGRGIKTAEDPRDNRQRV